MSWPYIKTNKISHSHSLADVKIPLFSIHNNVFFHNTFPESRVFSDEAEHKAASRLISWDVISRSVVLPGPSGHFVCQLLTLSVWKALFLKRTCFYASQLLIGCFNDQLIWIIITSQLTVAVTVLRSCSWKCKVAY